MITFRGMVVPAAEKAGMKVPDDIEDFDTNEYPHFHVFSIMQIGRRTNYHDEHWDNARIIAAIPDDKIRKVTVADLLDLGCSL